MSLANILHLSYWFSISTPPFRQGSFVATLIVLGIFFVGGIALKILAKQKRAHPPLARGLSRLARPLFFFAILGFVLVWFRQLGAAVLSARFWMFLVFAIAAVWFGLVLKSMLKTYKDEYARIEQRRKYEEYLPRKRK